MSNQYRSPASLQDVAREADVPTPKSGIPPRTGLLVAALVAISMTGLIGLFFVHARATAIQEAAPAQVAVPVQTAQTAAAVQWQEPGPGEAAKAGQTTQNAAHAR